MLKLNKQLIQIEYQSHKEWYIHTVPSYLKSLKHPFPPSSGRLFAGKCLLLLISLTDFSQLKWNVKKQKQNADLTQ